MTDDLRDQFDALTVQLRPKLHRYCVRMTGSAIDAEDIVQDALVKAITALPDVGVVDNPERWLFRIAHNTALDFLRRRARRPTMLSDEVLEMMAAPSSPDLDFDVVTTSLRTFMRLPALQRSAVILKDVLGHSVQEIASITGATEPAAKSALQRGRDRLRHFAREPEDIKAPALPDATRSRLFQYVGLFQMGDFDSVRAMLAEDVKLDLVAIQRRQGKDDVREYYARYAAAEQWAFAAASVDGRAAMVVYDRRISLDVPAYFVGLEFDGEEVVSVHDFLYARYAMEDIDLRLLDPETQIG